MTRIAVVGAGITGLATAHHLLASGRGDIAVTVVDAQARVGGKLQAEAFADQTVDVGADAFLARKPHTERLARSLGFGDEDLVAPATSRVYLWSGGRLSELPTGTILGVPTRIGPLLRSRAVSLGAVARVGLDLVMPREPRLTDRSVGDLVAERFGNQIVDVLVDPLLGGVYAGDPYALSVRATSPLLFDAARGGRSLLRTLNRARQAAASDGPVFLTLKGGLGQLATRLHASVSARTPVRTSDPVRLIERDGDGYRVLCSQGEAIVADVVVLAVPAYVAAALLRDLAPEVSAGLRAIDYASVATVSLAYDRTAVAHPLDGSGMLVPSREGRTIKAATFVSSKWPHRAADGRVLIRASVGRIGQDVLERSDDDIRTAVHRDLREALSISAAPLASKVTRWERALPQYAVGHLERVGELRQGLGDLPGVHLAGAAYDGVGVASLTARAEALAGELLG